MPGRVTRDPSPGREEGNEGNQGRPVGGRRMQMDEAATAPGRSGLSARAGEVPPRGNAGGPRTAGGGRQGHAPWRFRRGAGGAAGHVPGAPPQRAAVLHERGSSAAGFTDAVCPPRGTTTPDQGELLMTATAPTRTDAAEGRPTEGVAEAARRRTFAVISHPDAGKSTLTEALALHARVIGQAGAVHGKAGRRGTVSDWMDLERARGISITSAALQFSYRDTVVNLLDTPGHADFSEDTYRVLTAVDAAVMLIDAAKGLEPQTMKLYAVCRHRGIPVITVVNKWDRPGMDALALMDEVADRTGLAATPLTWPVGIAGDFRGVLDRRDGSYRHFTRTAGGAKIAPEQVFSAEEALAGEGDAWARAVEESEPLADTGRPEERR